MQLLLLLLLNNEQRQSPCLDVWPQVYLHCSIFLFFNLFSCFIKKLKQLLSNPYTLQQMIFSILANISRQEKKIDKKKIDKQNSVIFIS